MPGTRSTVAATRLRRAKDRTRASASTRRLPRALCGAAGAEEDNSFVRCVDAGRNGNPNVQVSTDFDDPTLADTVRVLSPY